MTQYSPPRYDGPSYDEPPYEKRDLRHAVRGWLDELRPRPRVGPRGEREQDRAEQATLQRAHRRQLFYFLAAAIVVVLLFGRTAYWQFFRNQSLAAIAQADQIHAFSVPAGRGAIYDADGRLLAVSVTQDTVIVDPDVLRATGALASTATRLASLLGLQSADVLRQISVPGAYVRLHDANGAMLLLTQAQSDAVNAAGLGGVALIPQVSRIYPDGALAAQVLGFVSRNGDKGAYGIEQRYESALAGTPGVLYTSVDGFGNPLATSAQRQTPASPGADVTLTLDATIQYWVEQGLAQTVASTQSDGGTVIVEDPKTGAILAMASLPSFNPNSYGASPLASFVNPAISDTYDPGSVMKAITMAAGIDSGVISPESTYVDNGSAVIDGVTLHNWADRGYGYLNMTQVLQYSANTGAIWVEQQLGASRLDQYLNGFGFQHTTGIELPGEAAGLSDNSGDAALAAAENSFGESIGVTPLQMVAAYGALANGGVVMRPYIVSSTTADGGAGATTTYGPHQARQVVSAQTAATVTAMLVNSAQVSEAEMNLLPGYTIAAKTGTSTPDPQNASVTYASVLGYAPATNPRFVLLVKLDHPKTDIFGGSAAGPLWRALASKLFTYYQIAPDAA